MQPRAGGWGGTCGRGRLGGSRHHYDGHRGRRRRCKPAFTAACHGEKRRAHRINSRFGRHPARTPPRRPWPPGGQHPPSPEIPPLGRCPVKDRSAAAAAREATCIMPRRLPPCRRRRAPRPKAPPPSASLAHGCCPAAALYDRTSGNAGAQEREGGQGRALARCRRRGSRRLRGGKLGRERRPSLAITVACHWEKRGAHRMKSLFGRHPTRTPPGSPWPPGGQHPPPPEMSPMDRRPVQGR